MPKLDPRLYTIFPEDPDECQKLAQEWLLPGVSVEPGVAIGHHCVIHPGVHIGTKTVIEPFCELGVHSPLAATGHLTIGASSHIRSRCTFYTGSTFGPGLRTGHGATVRENTTAGDAFQIGTLCDIQGHCEIGDHVRFHSNVHIGQGAKLGDFVMIFPYVVLTNDPTPPSTDLAGVIVEDFAVIATMSTVLPGVTIGKDAMVGANTLVRRDVPPSMICVGNPGQIVGSTDRVKLRSTGEPAYPWRRHFHRGYPADIVAAWVEEFRHG